MGACMSHTGVFLSPEVKVVNAKIRSAGLSGIQLDVILQVANPNPASLPVTRILYTLKKESDGTILADGVSRQLVTLQAGDPATPITIPMSFQYWGLGAAGKSIVTRGKTSVKVTREISFRAPMATGGTATSHFEDTVQLAVEDMMGG